MQASWNQWSNSAGSYAPNYPGTFPTAPSTNPFQVPSTGSVTTPAVSSQFSALYSQQQSQTTQQQWQQWEQWQQQYAQWQQQYGDKFQGSVQAGIAPASGTFPAMPPLPSSAPTVQPPPPDSVPPPSDRNEDSNKRPHEGSGNEESKKQKTGKGKAETLESLIESEKTFDQQFKSWEVSFIQWKEQNANHPDKAQYKEYEAKWESFRGQLLQKREILRKKRENKEAEVAAAAAAAKEAALATSNISNVQSGYSTTTANQTNPYMASSMMYPMSGVYPSQDMSQMMSGQAAPNYMSSYSMYNMPPPPSLPPMPVVPSVGGPLESLSNKLQDPLKATQSLEFLSSSATGNSKSIPGLDLVSDKSANPGFMSNIPVNSSLFSYNQDVTKPLHTSDDKPFNFPRPPRMNYDEDDTQNQYSYQRGRSRFSDNSLNQFRKNDFPPLDGPDQDRNDRFGNRNLRPSNDYKDDYNYRPGADTNFRNEDRANLRGDNRGAFRNDDRGNFRNEDRGNFRNEDRGNFRNEDRGNFRNDDRGNFRNDDRGNFRNEDRGNIRNDDRGKFGSSFTPSFSSDKYAKYLEDEYDDSRFRDPEPFESPQNSKSNFNRDDFHRGGGNFSNRQNFRNDSYGKDKFDEFNKRDFNDSRNTRGGFNDRRGGFNDRRGGFNDRRGGFNDRNEARAPFVADRAKDGAGFGSFNRDDNRFENRNQFGKPPPNDKDGPGRPGFGRRSGPEPDLPIVKSDSVGAESKSIPGPIRPMSLLDMPLMKPPEMFDEKKPFADKPGPPFATDTIASQPDEPQKSFPAANSRFSDFGKESKERESLRSTANAVGPPNLSSSLPLRDLVKSVARQEPAIVVPVVTPFVSAEYYEYDHISRVNDDAGVGVFEPVQVLDYSHGKKKTADFSGPLTKPAVVVPPSKPVAIVKDDFAWEGEWEENEKYEPVPLPPRNKNIDAGPIKKTGGAVVNSSQDVDKGDRQNNGDSHPLKDRNKDEERWPHNFRKEKEVPVVPKEEKPPASKPIDDLLCLPGRNSRAAKLVIIMRGPPGSGKTYTAKLIKDKEVEMGGSAPRILSLDDYFTVEDVEDSDSKSETKKTDTMKYEYDAAAEPSYLDSLVKSFKKTISDGFFPFIIVDCINEKWKKYEEMYNFAISKGFQVYICEMDRDLASCIKRNIHNRSEEDISKIIAEWEATPSAQTLVDIRSLLQSAAIPDVDMTEVSDVAAKPEEVKVDTETKTEEKVEEQNPDEKEAAGDTEKSETNVESVPEIVSTESPKKEPAPVSRTGSSFPTRGTFRGTPRMPAPPLGMYQFPRRRGFGGPIWRRGWPSRR